jgi:hypothetical protein
MEKLALIMLDPVKGKNVADPPVDDIFTRLKSNLIPPAVDWTSSPNKVREEVTTLFWGLAQVKLLVYGLPVGVKIEPP